MKREIINEEIERMKLLMKYNLKKTLSENTVKIISESASEAVLKDLFTVLKADAAGVKTSLKTAFNDGTMNWSKMVRTDSKVLDNVDDLVEAIKAGTLGPSGVGSVAKGLFLKGSSSEIRAFAADAITSMGQFNSKFAKKSKEEIIETLMRDSKYSRADAEVLTNTYIKKRGGTITPGGGQHIIDTPKPISGKPTRWQDYKDTIKGLARNKIVRNLFVAGGAYLLYKYLTTQGTTPFPLCLTTNLSEDDANIMGTEGLDKIKIIKTGDKTIDDNGGALFSDDKTFVTGNNKYSGKWSEETSGIVMTIGGTSYTMACGKGGEKSEDNTVKSKWRECPDFPLTRGCRSSKVFEFQKCIGVITDSKFGPKTEKGLMDKGYETTVTQEVYDKIISNCDSNSNSNVAPTTTTTKTVYAPENNAFNGDDLLK
jgi:hypothetical protein